MVLLPSASSSFSGIWYGAGASILVRTGFAGPSGRGAEHIISSAFFIQPWKKIACSVPYYCMHDHKVFESQVLTGVSGRLQLRPASSAVSGQCFCFPKNNFHIPSCVAPKKCWRVCGPSGLNSHMRRDLRWHGRIRQTNITWITLTRSMSLSRRVRMQLCKVCTSSTDPQSSPLLIHDASCGGGPEQNAGIAAHLVLRGSVT